MTQASDQPERPVTATTAKRDEAKRQMLRACQGRFPVPGFEVKCDDTGTVWVKCVSTSTSIGLQPWLLRSHSTEDVLERAERKLGVSCAESRSDSHALPS